MLPFILKNLFNKDRFVLSFFPLYSGFRQARYPGKTNIPAFFVSYLFQFKKSNVNSENINKKSTLFWWAV